MKDPQTWNRYSYVLNNPLKYIDPLGLYVFSAELGGSQSDEQLRKGAKTEKEKETVENIITRRDKFRDALSEARSAANDPTLSQEQRERAQRAVNSYGDFNDHKTDDVIVGFVKKDRDSSTTGLGQKDGRIHVHLNLDVKDRNPSITVAHEGSHVVDYQAFLAGTGSDMRLFFTETRAYFVSSYMAQALVQVLLPRSRPGASGVEQRLEAERKRDQAGEWGVQLQSVVDNKPGSTVERPDK